MENDSADVNGGQNLITEFGSTVDDKRRLYQVKVNNAMLQRRLQVDINDRIRIFKEKMTRHEDEMKTIRRELVKIKSRSPSVDRILGDGRLRDPGLALQKRLIVREIEARRSYNQSQFCQARAQANREQRLHQSRNDYVTIKKRRKTPTKPEQKPRWKSF